MNTRYLAIRAGDTEDGTAVFVTGCSPTVLLLENRSESEIGAHVQAGDLVIWVVIYESSTGEQVLTITNANRNYFNVYAGGESHGSYGSNLFYWAVWFYVPAAYDDTIGLTLGLSFSDFAHVVSQTFRKVIYRNATVDNGPGTKTIFVQTGTGPDLSTPDPPAQPFTTVHVADLLVFTCQSPALAPGALNETNDEEVMRVVASIPEGGGNDSINLWTQPVRFSGTFERSFTRTGTGSTDAWVTLAFCVVPRGAGPLGTEIGEPLGGGSPGYVLAVGAGPVIAQYDKIRGGTW